MDENVIRWMTKSICKHFDDNKNGYPMYFDGVQASGILPETRFELRLNGPEIYTSQTQDTYIIRINLLVRYQIDPTTPFGKAALLGTGAVIFTLPIEILKLGDGDDSLGCLELLTPITITNFSTEKGSDLDFSTIEGTYRLCP